MFYSLKELQLWVFGRPEPSSGGNTAKTVDFGQIFALCWYDFARISGSVGGNWGVQRAVFGPPEAPKSFSSYGGAILDGFWKIEFLTIFDLFWPLRPPLLPPTRPLQIPRILRKLRFLYSIWSFFGVFTPRKRFSQLRRFDSWVKP